MDPQNPLFPSLWENVEMRWKCFKKSRSIYQVMQKPHKPKIKEIEFLKEKITSSSDKSHDLRKLTQVSRTYQKLLEIWFDFMEIEWKSGLLPLHSSTHMSSSTFHEFLFMDSVGFLGEIQLAFGRFDLQEGSTWDCHHSTLGLSPISLFKRALGSYFVHLIRAIVLAKALLLCILSFINAIKTLGFHLWDVLPP